MESVKKIAKFAVSFANSIDKSLDNNSFGLEDIPNMMEPLTLIGPAVEAVKDAREQFKAGTPEQKAELVTQIKADLDLRSDRTEEIVERALDLVVQVSEIVKLVKA